MTSHIVWSSVTAVMGVCNVKVKDRVPSKELTERLGIDDIILILQQNKPVGFYGPIANL